MLIDGKTVYPYLVLLTDGPPVFGFDVEPIEKVQARWLNAWRELSKRMQALSGPATRAEIKKNVAAKRVIEDGIEDADDVSIPDEPHFSPFDGMVFKLNGIPTRDGYGSVSVLADIVRGLSYIDHERLAGITLVRMAPVNSADQGGEVKLPHPVQAPA
jgi:hypothetical protein